MEDEEEDEEFFGRPPMGPRVRSERPQEGHHGKDGRHGHHGRGGRHTRSARIMKLVHAIVMTIGVALVATHFYFIKCFKTEQDALEKITGKKECGWGNWKKKCGGRFQQQTVVAAQPVIVEYSPIVQETTINSESSIEEISEDKQEFGIVYAPNPTGIHSNNNQMV
jgi:hypothetical protein